MVGAALPQLRRRCCCRPGPATSSSTGAATTTSAAARTARCTPTTRWARCCGAARGRTARTRRTSGRCATSCRWCASTSASTGRGRGAPRARRRAAPSAPDRSGARRAERYAVPAAGLADGAGATCCAQVAARPEVRARAREAPQPTYGRVYYKSRAKHRWQVSFFAPPKGHGRSKEISQTVVDDRSGRVLESWTGYKVEWTMARGYAGAFGRIANALWIWLAALRCCSCCRSRARRGGCCTSTSWCCWRSRSPTRSSTRRGSTSSSRSSIRCWRTCSCAC